MKWPRQLQQYVATAPKTIEPNFFIIEIVLSINNNNEEQSHVRVNKLFTRTPNNHAKKTNTSLEVEERGRRV